MDAASKRTIGWIGMGSIGLPMAARAAGAGWRVCGYDPVPERRRAARAAGIEIVTDPAEAGRAAERLVVCVVRSVDQLQEALLGDRGALCASPGRLGVVMSSVGAAAMQLLGRRASQVSAAILDAPILGNPLLAASGGLTIVASGANSDLDAARPLLADLAGSVVDLGARLGSAQAMKMVSQLLQIVDMVATIEGVELADRYAVPPEAVVAVLETTASSWTTRNWGYASGLWARADRATSLGLFAKDLAAAVSDSHAVGLDLSLAQEALSLIERRLDNA